MILTTLFVFEFEFGKSSGRRRFSMDKRWPKAKVNPEEAVLWEKVFLKSELPFLITEAWRYQIVIGNNPLSGLTCNGTVESDALRLFWCGLICGHISLESCYGFDSIACICICVMHVLYFHWIDRLYLCHEATQYYCGSNWNSVCNVMKSDSVTPQNCFPFSFPTCLIWHQDNAC